MLMTKIKGELVTLFKGAYLSFSDRDVKIVNKNDWKKGELNRALWYSSRDHWPVRKVFTDFYTLSAFTHQYS